MLLLLLRDADDDDDVHHHHHHHAARFSERLVLIYHRAQSHIPEESSVHLYYLDVSFACLEMDPYCSVIVQ